MMPVEFNELFFGFLKIMFVLAGVLYLIFSIVVIRQIYNMQRSLMTSFSGKLVAIGYIHLAFSGLALLFFVASL